jgi:uncharacterized protein (DUF58 family)
MIPTLRFVLLLLLAVPLMALSGGAPVLAWAGLGWCALLLAVGIADNRLSARAQRVLADRLLDRKLSLDADNRVRLRLENLSRWTASLTVKDDPPDDFRLSTREAQATVPGYATLEVSYAVRPRHRGRFTFGDLHLRGWSLLGLSLWQKRVEAALEVDVYPNLESVRRYDLLVRANRLEEMGFRRVRARGAGTDFESLREYVPDDDFRRIDWKATARRARPFTREYEEERSRTIMLLLDAGRMMSAEAEGLSKLDHAINAALMLAYVALRRDDAVGLIVFADTVSALLPPRKGQAQLQRLVEVLHDIQPTLSEPNYRAAMYHLRDRARKRSLAVLFTDLVDEEASRRLIAHVAAAYPRHLPLVVTLSDPTLDEAARSAPDSEASLFERAVAAQVLADREKAFAALRSRGAVVLDVPAAELTVSVVNRYLELKERMRV